MDVSKRNGVCYIMVARAVAPVTGKYIGYDYDFNSKRSV